MRGEPDLDFLIQTIRHVAAHRTLTSNYQVGGDLIKGLRKVLDIKTVDSAAMFSSYVVRALARNVSLLVEAQSRYHGTPIYAANLCAADHYDWRAPEADAMTAMDRLEESKGDVVNQWLARGPRLHAPFEPAVHVFKGPDISVLTAPLATVSTPNG
jgi:hypothetical protein